jgi:Phospholipase_D-nuclease N-terminal
MLRYLPFLLVLALWIYAFVDCLNTPEEEVRHLPKVVWVIIILLFGEVLVGPVAWLVTGKVRRAPETGSTPTPFSTGHRNTAATWVAPDDNPEFLKSLDKDDPKGD